MQRRQLFLFLFLFFKCCVGVALNRETSVRDDYATEICMLQWQLLINFFLFFMVIFLLLLSLLPTERRFSPYPGVCACMV